MAAIRIYRTEIAAAAEELFSWHRRDPAFARYNPPFEPVKVIERKAGADGLISDGAEILLSIQAAGPLQLRWRIGHCCYHPPHQFEDYQISGPFRSWHHCHRFKAIDQNHSVLEDEVKFELPVPSSLLTSLVASRLNRLFAYRGFIISGDLALFKQYSPEPKTILIAGGSGLVGTALREMLGCLGHKVILLVRKKPGTEANNGDDQIYWNPAARQCDLSTAPDFDAVINLSGESIAGIWSSGKKRRILESRVDSTAALVSALRSLKRRPPVFVCASAIGYYGAHPSGVCDEEAAAGSGFLADVCRQWEAEARKAEELGIRTVRLRTGIVISPRGGTLASMLTPFRCGLGGPLGTGPQKMSWIALDDLLGAIYHSIQNDSVSGAVNAVSPTPLSNKTFTEELADALHRPAFIPVPAALLRLLPGDFAEQTVLSSIEALPKKLIATGYTFRLMNIRQTLNTYLGNNRLKAD